MPEERASFIEVCMQKSEEGLFYGWYIVIIAFIGNFISTGTGFYIFNAFMEPICIQRGWTRTDINIAPMIGWLTFIFCSLLYGTLLVRIGPRLIMTVGSILSAFSFIMLGGVHDIRMFYMFYMLLFMGNGAMGGIVANTAVNNWFVRKRGRALGIATAGISLSGAVVPYIAMLILEIVGLEHAFRWIGIAILMVAPLAFMALRNRPEDHGLLPDGVKPGDGGVEGIPPGENPISASGEIPPGVDSHDRYTLWLPSMLVRSKAFWKLGLAYGLVVMGVSGIMFQLKPHFSDIGFDSKTAMTMMAATALVGSVGKYVWGMLCDRFTPQRVVAVLISAIIAGLILALQRSLLALVLFIIIFGFSMGGVMSTFPVFIAHLFGRESFALVARFLGLLLGINIIGYIIMGQSFDRTGSYNIAYAIFIVLDIIAVSLILTISKPETNH
jgi:OFA family oxalate/formate antiporter-like MFS transporter